MTGDVGPSFRKHHLAPVESDHTSNEGTGLGPIQLVSVSGPWLAPQTRFGSEELPTPRASRVVLRHVYVHMTPSSS